MERKAERQNTEPTGTNTKQKKQLRQGEQLQSELNSFRGDTAFLHSR